jgi:hypothetical protein
MTTTRQDWLARNHEDLYDQAQQTWEYLSIPNIRVRMGFAMSTPQGQWLDNTFEPVYNDFHLAFEEWKSPATRTPFISEHLFATEKVFKQEYRQLYTGFLKESPLVTDEDLLAMGLPKRHTGGGKPAPVPTDYPAAQANTATMRRVGIDYYEDNATHRKAKPAGVHGVEVRWAVFDAIREVHIDDLVHSSFDTRTPLILEFADEQRGKVLYYALRWENTRGEKGPFGPIENVIIP